MISLTPPRLVTFVVSVALIALAVASIYMRVPLVGRFVVSHRTAFFIAAYVVLALGVVSRSL